MARTAKPMGTISYNTEPFLRRKLEQMLNANIIDDYRYIKHYGEDGDKDHFHVWVTPNGQRDFGQIREEFNEIDPTNTKPLQCMPFRHSETLNWLMYVLHDAEYLANHHSDNDGDGKIPYQLEDVKTPYPEQLERDYKRAIPLRATATQQVINGLLDGMNALELAYKLGVNPLQIKALEGMVHEFRSQAMEKQAEQEDRMRDYITEDGEFVRIPLGFEPETEQISFGEETKK